MTTESDNPPGYELVRRIGSGATSVVWEAAQLSTGRRVALKMLDIDVTDPAALRRFERERKVMSSLATHPGGSTPSPATACAGARPRRRS